MGETLPWPARVRFSRILHQSPEDGPPHRRLRPNRQPPRRLLRSARTATQRLRIAQAQVSLEALGLEALGLAGDRQRITPRRECRRVSLLDARQQSYEPRKITRAGGDLVALKRKPDVPTFAEAVETVIAIGREGWKHAGKSEK